MRILTYFLVASILAMATDAHAAWVAEDRDFALQMKSQADEYAALCKSKSIDGIIVLEEVACLRGPIDRHLAATFLKSDRSKLKFLVVDSPGGVSLAALDIADAILGNDVTVIVSHQCISACANYLFPAGKWKLVLDDSEVYWHGDITLFLPDQKKYPGLTYEEVKAVYERVQGFYQRAGINPNLASKMTPSALKLAEELRRSGEPGFVMWSRRAEDLRDNFNVQGILYMYWPEDDPKWHKKNNREIQ